MIIDISFPRRESILRPVYNWQDRYYDKNCIFVKSIVIMQNQKLSDLQLELLNVYSFQPSEEDMNVIRQFLAGYFSDKLLKNVQKGIDKKGITEEELDRWVNE